MKKFNIEKIIKNQIESIEVQGEDKAWEKFKEQRASELSFPPYYFNYSILLSSIILLFIVFYLFSAPQVNSKESNNLVKHNPTGLLEKNNNKTSTKAENKEDTKLNVIIEQSSGIEKKEHYTEDLDSVSSVSSFSSFSSEITKEKLTPQKDQNNNTHLNSIAITDNQDHDFSNNAQRNNASSLSQNQTYKTETFSTIENTPQPPLTFVNENNNINDAKSTQNGKIDDHHDLAQNKGKRYQPIKKINRPIIQKNIKPSQIFYALATPFDSIYDRGNYKYSYPMKKLFLEHQTLLSSNGIYNYDFALGKQVYSRDKHGIEVLAGFSLGTGLSVSRDTFFFTNGVQLIRERKESDLSYLIDATLGSYYTWSLENLQLGVGFNAYYGIYNLFDTKYSLKMSNLDGGNSESAGISNERNKWEHLNRMRVRFNLKASYRLNRHWLIGASMSKQSNPLIKNGRAAKNKNNTPLLFGAHLEYILQ